MIKRHRFLLILFILLLFLTTTLSALRLKYIDVLSPIPHSTIKNNILKVHWYIKDSKNYHFRVKLIDAFSKKTFLSIHTPQTFLQIPVSQLQKHKQIGLSIEGYQGQKLTAISRYLSFKISPTENNTDITLEKVPLKQDKKREVFNKVKDFFISRKGHLSTFEKTSWWLLKYVFGPSLSSVIFVSTAGAFPPLWLMGGELLVNGATTGLFSYLYDKRMKQLGLSNKSEKEMRFDAIITACERVSTLPFYVLGGNIAGIGSQLGFSTILRQALLGGLFRFGASTIGSGATGILRHYLAHNYLHIDEKIKALEQKKYIILAKYVNKKIEDIPPQDQEKLLKIDQEIDYWKSKDYSLKNFKIDVKKGIVNGLLSGWGGALPKTAVKTFAQTAFPARLSTKIFGGPAHSEQIAELILLHPFTFLSGYSNAKIKEDTTLKDIAYLKAKQSMYPKNSLEWNFYASQIKFLTQKYQNISPVKEGAIEMATMAGIKLSSFAYEALKANLIELPANRNREIEELYRSKSPHWKKVQELKEKYEKLSQNPPKKENFSSVGDYLKAKLAYDKKLQETQENYQAATIKALYLDKDPQNLKLRKLTEKEYARQEAMEKELALAKYLGKEKYKKVLIHKLSKMKEFRDKSPQELSLIAEKQLQKDYQELYKNNLIEIQNMEDKLKKINQNASLNRQFDKMVKSGLVIKPSEYKTKYIITKIDQLRSQGISDSEIKSKYYKSIFQEASQKTSELFGKDPHTIALKELIATYLKQGKYDSDKNIADKIKEVIKNSSQSLLIRTLGETNADINKYILTNILNDDNKENSSKKLPDEIIENNTYEILNKIYLENYLNSDN